MFSLCLYYFTRILVLFNLANLDVERDATDLCLTLSIEGGSREAAHTQRYHAYSHALLYLIYTKAVGRLTSNAVCRIHFIKRFSAQQMLPLMYQVERLPAAIVATVVAVAAAIAITKKYPSGCPPQLSLL